MSRHAVDRFAPKLQSKKFTDLLGPVRRYLQSKIGHAWDDVYSELSKSLGSGTYPIRHVLYQHILSRPYFSAFNDHRGSSPLYFWGNGGYFYVDREGIVRWHRADLRYHAESLPVRRVRLDDERWFVEIDGIWYIGRYVAGDFPDEIIWPNHKRDTQIWRFVKIKQANKRELRSKDQLLSKATS